MIEINNLTKNKISKMAIEKFLKRVLKKLNIKKDLSLAFVGLKEIRKLNRIYLKRDRPTDVLSFSGEKNFLGEIVISLERAKKQAKEQKHSLEKEIKILIIHGLLHLLGFNHQTKKDKEKMESLQERLLKLS